MHFVFRILKLSLFFHTLYYAGYLVLWNMFSYSLELKCGESLNYCPEELVNITCAVNSTVFRWIIEDRIQTRILFFTVSDDVGATKLSGPFSTILVKKENPEKRAVLLFSYAEEMNGTTVICENVVDAVSSRCSFFSYGKNYAYGRLLI